MQTGTIYALAEPETGEIRYIGKTIKKPEERYYSHIYSPNNKMYVGRWIIKLAKKNLLPKLVILEKNIPLDKLDEREIFWIKNGREAGWRLTNTTDGGGGALGFKMPKEIVERVALTKRGKKLSAEHRAKTSASMKGRPGHPMPEGHLEKMIKAREGILNPRKGIKMSEEARKHLSEINKGKHHTEETKAKISATSKGKIFSEETRAKISASKKGTPRSLETRAKIIATKKVKSNPLLNWEEEYRKAVFNIKRKGF